MTRPILPAPSLAPEASKFIAAFHADVIQKVSETVKREKIVVVGMAQNPFVKKARQALDAAGLSYTYLEFGSYFSQWKQRLAIKLWSGWPTYPQVFVKGILIGGFQETKAMIDSGEIKKRLG